MLAAAQQPPPPQPFPRPRSRASRPQRRTTAAPPAAGRRHAADPAEAAPTEATLGVPIYPGAQFLASYDAGRGQRYLHLRDGSRRSSIW